MARHNSTTTRDGHTTPMPAPVLSSPAGEAIKERDKGMDCRNEHDLGIDEQLNARFEHGLREDGWMEKI